MALFHSASKALPRSLFPRKIFHHRIPNYSNYSHTRRLISTARNPSFSSADKLLAGASRNSILLPDCEYPTGTSNYAFFQKRGFLGCGDGEEGNILSKVYEERQVVGYSPEQLFDVVAAVDMYQDFLPWCQRSEIVRRHPDGRFDAELEIGFKFLVESYVSHVELNRPNSIKTTSSQSSLFDHLINVWEFNPGPVPGTCDLHFFVDFKFQSPLYRQIANMFFKEVVSQLVGSFSDRCRLIYGPGVHLHETTYQQRP